MLVVRAHPTVSDMFSIGLYFLFEQALCKSSGVLPAGADLVPVGVFQVLVGFLGLDIFLIWGSPHEAGVAVVRPVIHRNSFCP